MQCNLLDNANAATAAGSALSLRVQAVVDVASFLGLDEAVVGAEAVRLVAAGGLTHPELHLAHGRGRDLER